MSQLNREKNGERGAATVEFALVSSLLFLIMFGILQYGLYFNDALSARQGVREGARQGVVRNFTPLTGCATQPTDMDKLRCNTKQQIDALTGAVTAILRAMVANVSSGQPSASPMMSPSVTP